MENDDSVAESNLRARVIIPKTAEAILNRKKQLAEEWKTLREKEDDKEKGKVVKFVIPAFGEEEEKEEERQEQNEDGSTDFKPTISELSLFLFILQSFPVLWRKGKTSLVSAKTDEKVKLRKSLYEVIAIKLSKLVGKKKSDYNYERCIKLKTRAMELLRSKTSILQLVGSFMHGDRLSPNCHDCAEFQWEDGKYRGINLKLQIGEEAEEQCTSEYTMFFDVELDGVLTPLVINLNVCKSGINPATVNPVKFRFHPCKEKTESDDDEKKKEENGKEEK